MLTALCQALTGCRIVQFAADVHGQPVRAVIPGGFDKPAAEPVEVQQLLMRLSDDYLTRMVYGLDELRGAPTRRGRANC